MCEIRRLRLEQEKQAHVALSRGVSAGVSTRNPFLMAELRCLRQRRDELECRMAGLQSSRRELMAQLEGLMQLLRVVCAWLYSLMFHQHFDATPALTCCSNLLCICSVIIVIVIGQQF